MAGGGEETKRGRWSGNRLGPSEALAAWCSEKLARQSLCRSSRSTTCRAVVDAPSQLSMLNTQSVIDIGWMYLLVNGTLSAPDLFKNFFYESANIYLKVCHKRVTSIQYSFIVISPKSHKVI